MTDSLLADITIWTAQQLPSAGGIQAESRALCPTYLPNREFWYGKFWYDKKWHDKSWNGVIGMTRCNDKIWYDKYWCSKVESKGQASCLVGPDCLPSVLTCKDGWRMAKI